MPSAERKLVQLTEDLFALLVASFLLLCRLHFGSFYKVIYLLLALFNGCLICHLLSHYYLNHYYLNPYYIKNISVIFIRLDILKKYLILLFQSLSYNIFLILNVKTEN